MARIIFILLLFCSFGAFAQADEGYIKNAIDNLRVNTLTPARVGNVLDLINYGKSSINGVYTASGTNTYAVTGWAGITNLDAGKTINVKFTNANTSTTTSLNVNGLGAIPLKTNLGADPDVNGIRANSFFQLASTGTTWVIVGPTNAGGTVLVQWGDIPTGTLPDQVDLYDTLATRSKRWYKIKTVTSNYTPEIGDEDNKIIIVDGGATFTLPSDATQDFPIGSAIFAVDSLGTASFIKDSGVTIDTVDSRIWIKVSADKYITARGAPGSGGGSGTVQSVTGTAVDNTDPTNPVVNAVTSVGLTTGTSGNSPNVSGSPVTTSGNITLNLPLMSSGSITAGLVSNTTQTIPGAKTFSSAPTFSSITGTGGFRVGGLNSSGTVVAQSGYNWTATSTDIFFSTSQDAQVANTITNTNTGDEAIAAHSASTTAGDTYLFQTGVNYVGDGSRQAETGGITTDAAAGFLLRTTTDAPLTFAHNDNVLVTTTDTRWDIRQYLGFDGVAAPTPTAGVPQLYADNTDPGQLYVMDGTGVSTKLSTSSAARTNVTISSTSSVAATDDLVHISGGSFTLTLLTATAYPQYQKVVINNTGSGTITLATTGGQTINGTAPGVLIAGQNITVYRVGTAFFSY